MVDTYSRRRILETRGSEPDVVKYYPIPTHLRRQIAMILSDSIGGYHFRTTSGMAMHATALWNNIDRICTKEIDSYASAGNAYLSSSQLNKVLGFILKTQHVDDWLSVVEICCRTLQYIQVGRNTLQERNATQKPEEGIAEINARFVEHALGYAFENGQIIRVDSRLLHTEVIKPALLLLVNPIFVKANKDFMTAHELIRSGNFKDSVTAANRSFESMLKAICDQEHWEYTSGDGASELVTKVVNKGLLSHGFDRSFTAYVAMLKAGLPSVRNDAGAHGEGIAATAVTPHIAQFAVNLTASNLLLLADSYNEMKRR